MNLNRLELLNFRQFAGEHRIEFSNEDSQKITVIHGENGAGKTTLLNAFKWVFYAKTDFDTKEENLLNEHALSSAQPGVEVKVKVSVEFEHARSTYTATRARSFKKMEGATHEPIGGTTFDLNWIGQDGRYNKSINPEAQMRKILPQEMHSYFFFNGERIEKLASASGCREIQKAIKSLMGLEIVERAGAHLSGSVRRTFHNELKEKSAGELTEIVEQEESARSDWEHTLERISAARANVRDFEEEITTIGKRLAALREAAHLQSERQLIDQELKNLTDQLKTNRKRQSDLISGRGFLAFFRDAADQAHQILDERRKRGELPAKVKQQFLDDLLAQGHCVCDRQLKAGEAPYEAVEKFKKYSASPGLEEAFISTSGELRQVDQARERLFDELSKLLAEKEQLSCRRKELLGRRDDISSKLSESEIEDVARLEQKRQEREKQRIEEVKLIGSLEYEERELKGKLAEVTKKREKLAAERDQVRATRQKLQLAEELSRIVKELHMAISHQVRDNLSGKVNGTFQKILTKNYWAEIDNEYRLQVYKEIPEQGRQPVVEKSTGENQIVSLCFIGSIVSLAKERHAEKTPYFRGGVYPIVMDSPFGQLDETYRKLVARYIPQLAEQIILMATGSQWKGPVERECRPHVGKHVSLIYHAPKVEKESAYVRGGADHEFTEIEEGYHG